MSSRPAPAFPGGAAVSGLEVYDWPAEDGRRGGTPHVHLACAEAYAVVAGEGELHTLTADGLRITPLRPGTVAWFGPGTIHRTVNTGEALHAVVVTQNGGLPEAGDAVLTFPPEFLDDPAAYAAAAEPPTGAGAARYRRDLAVRGFRTLVHRVAAGDTEALPAFYRRALALRADRLGEWQTGWRNGPKAAALRTGDQLAALRDGRIDHLLEAAVAVRAAPTRADRAYGLCGRLDVYDLEPAHP
ncbi:cupin domain-containing protein [Peterkaempfera bronchialis]|uniref:cupin domain-containing protein n=1 Tax=Peterkaempfera bronchialis TaxID=2126346 RepID=UPI003C2CBB35